MTAMRIPFGTVTLTERTKKLVMDCLERGRISSGKLVREFEERFAELIGAKEAVAVSSGTDADTLAVALLYEFGANRGDEVIVPALSFVSTGNAVLHAGFIPKFVDIELKTLNIDITKLDNALTQRTKAIMPVHLMGKPAEMNTIRSFATKHDLFVVEDAAEAYGAVYKGRNVGTIGNVGAFSSYVAHIVTTGEGGVVVTDNKNLAETLRSLRAHGRACKCKTCVSNLHSGFCEKRFASSEVGDIRFHFERIGYSSKMNELEAAIGLGTLDLYNEILEKRHNNLLTMIHRFEEYSNYFLTIQEKSGEKIGPHAFPFVVLEGAPFTRDELMLHLEKSGVDARTLFGSIPTQCGGYEFLGYNLGDFPNAEYIGRHGVHVGVHQDVTDQDIDWFVNCVGEFISQAEKR